MKLYEAPLPTFPPCIKEYGSKSPISLKQKFLPAPAEEGVGRVL